MGQYLQAVELALKHDEVDMATTIADRPESDSALRKRLWLAVAKKVISQSDGISTYNPNFQPFLTRTDQVI